MTGAPAARSNTVRLVALAGVLGLAAGLAAVYVNGGFSGNRAERAQCRQADAVAGRLAPLATGEVAAFQVERAPVPIPNLTFRDGEGRDTALERWRGRAVLLNLWATWCAPCRHEMPALDRLQTELGGAAFDVVAVSIDLGSDARPRQFYAETGITRLAFFQDTTGRIFQDLRNVGRAVGMPTTVLIDRDGCILGHLSGPAEWASPDALRLIRAALGS